ncbi:MAG: PfkB family carbohydrate kinase [Litorimonas sp.]
MPHVVCAGLITVDFLYTTPHFPAEGTKIRADAAHMVAGGGAFYAASAVASLGGQASLAGAVGNDALAAIVRTALDARGIDAAPLRTIDGVDTARSAVIISAGGERTVINHRDAVLFESAPSLPAHFDAALADTRWPVGAAALMRAARQAGKPGVLDAESPVRLASEALHAASHVVFSEQGLRDYAGGCDAAALASVAQDLDAWVAVTRGALPVLWHKGAAFGTVDTFATTPVDTLGAGDMWHGAFALALAQGQAEIDAARYANAAAAFKVAHTPGILPTAADVAALLA